MHLIFLYILQIAVELPGRKREELLVAIATTTTCPELIQLLLSKIHLLEEWEGKEGMKCAMVEVDPTTKGDGGEGLHQHIWSLYVYEQANSRTLSKIHTTTMHRVWERD